MSCGSWTRSFRSDDHVRWSRDHRVWYSDLDSPADCLSVGKAKGKAATTIGGIVGTGSVIVSKAGEVGVTISAAVCKVEESVVIKVVTEKSGGIRYIH